MSETYCSGVTITESEEIFTRYFRLSYFEQVLIERFAKIFIGFLAVGYFRKMPHITSF